MELFKKASLPSIESYAKQLAVRQNLTIELRRTIRSLQEENVQKTLIVDSDESANAFCNVIEAIFIHGLKDKFTARVTAVFGNNAEKIPEPQFWTFVSKYCHKNVLSEIKNLNQITTDIGRCRSWLRIALNEGLIVSYMGTILSDKTSLQKFYDATAYLRDEEQSDIMKQLLEGTNIFHFELSCNNSILNAWNSFPLTLANLWTPPATPQPVMPAVDVIDFFTEQKGQIKSTKNIFTVIETKEAVDDTSECHVDESRDINCATISESVLTEEKISKEFKEVETQAADNKRAEVASKIPLYPHDNEDANSKISSSDSVPDFDTDTVENLPEVTDAGSLGNKLNSKSGWSSEFEENPEEKDDDVIQSYDSLLQSYNKNLSKVVIGTPELADTFSSIMCQTDENDEYIESPEAKSPDLDFEIIPKYFTSEGADEETKKLLSNIGKLSSEQGLDVQNYQCYACARPIGLIYGKSRLCYFDGYNYCLDCHENDEIFIPARIVHNWDFNKYPVSKRAKAFLSRITKDPLFDIKNLNPVIYTAVEEMAQLQLLRTQLTFLRSYIFTCKESIVEQLRARLWPREYLFEHVHLYAVDDLLEIPNGTLAQTLQKTIAFAKNHVMGCQLCLVKGFICEICNNPKPIYPFDVESTYHCEKCLAVYHDYCMDSNKYCPKCARRSKRQQMLESASID